jgi:hypothetical protein
MPTPRKLQVFVSSTYSDLRDERQAAVEAILTAGHIPAGMELFAAGDETQMTVIRRWIAESDVFMLILGSRYGSIDPETQKSYVQLEYEYASVTQKALFAIVKSDDLSPSQASAVEHADKLEAFRAVVKQKIVRFWSDPRDVKLAIHEALGEFARRPELIGWHRAQNVDLGVISEEVARLSRENAALRDQLASATPRIFNGLRFEELFRLLATTRWIIHPQNSQEMQGLAEIAQFFGHEKPAPLHLLWRFSTQLVRGTNLPSSLWRWAQVLEEAGLIELSDPDASATLYRLTSVGKQFLLCLRNANDMTAAEEFRA